MPLTVDVHSHVVPTSLPDMTSDGYGRWPGLTRDGERGMILTGGRPFRPVDSRCWTPAARVEDLDACGVDVQVISPTPITLCHDAPPEGAAALARAQNDFMADFVAAAPDRLAAFGAVPLQAPDVAAAELERCTRELGFAGVEIGTVIGAARADGSGVVGAGPTELWDPALEPFWAAAEDLGTTVFLHPADLPCAARLAPLDLAFGVGMPCETGTAAAGLVVSGLLARHPRLQILLAHGGGALPWLLPRLDQGWEILPRQQERISEPPSHYARRFLVDSLTYDAAGLALAAERFGTGHVLLGTDSPFAAREEPPGAAVAEALKRGLVDSRAAEMILGANAARLLGLRSEGGTDG